MVIKKVLVLAKPGREKKRERYPIGTVVKSFFVSDILDCYDVTTSDLSFSSLMAPTLVQLYKLSNIVRLR